MTVCGHPHRYSPRYVRCPRLLGVLRTVKFRDSRKTRGALWRGYKRRGKRAKQQSHRHDSHAKTYTILSPSHRCLAFTLASVRQVLISRVTGQVPTLSCADLLRPTTL